VTRHVAPKSVFETECDGGATDSEIHPIVAIGWSVEFDYVPTERSLDLIDVAATEVASAGPRLFFEECVDQSGTKLPMTTNKSHAHTLGLGHGSRLPRFVLKG
jgi:hypothetical protein